MSFLTNTLFWVAFAGVLFAVRRQRVFWPLLALGLLLLFNHLFTPGFFDLDVRGGHLYGQRIDILNQGAKVMLVALGMTLVIATGALNTALVLGRWPTDWRSPYQALLAGKVAVVAAMTGLAVLNRYVVVPRMRGSRSWAGAFAAAVRIEIALGVAAVACVGVFGLWDPA